MTRKIGRTFPQSAIRNPLAVMLLLFCCINVQADDREDNPALAQAKGDYKEFLSQLQVLNQQYLQITGEMKETLKETGVPAFDEETGEFSIKPYEEHDTQVEGARVVSQSKKDMTLELELPGLKKESIRVKVEDGQFLRINAERKSALMGGHLEKVISLPAPVKEEGSEALYEDGILTIKVLKADKKEISIPVR